MSDLKAAVSGVTMSQIVSEGADPVFIEAYLSGQTMFNRYRVGSVQDLMSDVEAAWAEFGDMFNGDVELALDEFFMH